MNTILALLRNKWGLAHPEIISTLPNRSSTTGYIVKHPRETLFCKVIHGNDARRMQGLAVQWHLQQQGFPVCPLIPAHDGRPG